jgi:adenylate cyclase
MAEQSMTRTRSRRYSARHPGARDAVRRRPPDGRERENAERAADGRQEIRYCLALHVGDVMYGNIGGAARLDFTVIGPAVNLTSRLESMCKSLERSPLLSEEFVRASGVAAEFLGEFSLKGVTEKQTIFGLRE